MDQIPVYVRQAPTMHSRKSAVGKPRGAAPAGAKAEATAYRGPVGGNPFQSVLNKKKEGLAGAGCGGNKGERRDCTRQQRRLFSNAAINHPCYLRTV